MFSTWPLTVAKVAEIPVAGWFVTDGSVAVGVAKLNEGFAQVKPTALDACAAK